MLAPLLLQMKDPCLSVDTAGEREKKKTLLHDIASALLLLSGLTS